VTPLVSHKNKKLFMPFGRSFIQQLLWGPENDTVIIIISV